MTDAANIGDKSGVKSVSPSLRQLFLDASTVAINWVLRQLSGGAWTVTDTTAASSAGGGAGALVVDGGIAAKIGVYAAQGSGTYAGVFTGTGGISYLGTGSEAALFAQGIDQNASMCDGTYAVNAYGDDGKINAEIGYYTNGVAGVSGGGFSGGIKTAEGTVEGYAALAESGTLAATNSIVNLTASGITATLPASTAGRVYTIKATAAGGATVATTGSELIDGLLTQVLGQYDAMTVVGTGTGWIII